MKKRQIIGMTMLIFLCGTVTLFYLEMWLPHRTLYNSRQVDFEDDCQARKKVRDACHKILGYRIGNYHAVFMAICDVGNKDSVPYLIQTLKRLNLKSQSQKGLPTDRFYVNYKYHIDRCSSCLNKLTGMNFGADNIKWRDWWEQTGQHLPFDEEKRQLTPQEETK